MLARLAATALLAALLPALPALAQDAKPAAVTQGISNIKRTPLQKFDVPGTPYETVIGIAEVVPNVNIGRHSHFGPESGYMLEGEMVLMVAGQPDKPVKAGDSYQIPAGMPAGPLQVSAHDAVTANVLDYAQTVNQEPHSADEAVNASAAAANRSARPCTASSPALRLDSASSRSA